MQGKIYEVCQCWMDQAFVGSVDSRKVSESESDVFVNSSILSARWQNDHESICQRSICRVFSKTL